MIGTFRARQDQRDGAWYIERRTGNHHWYVVARAYKCVIREFELTEEQQAINIATALNFAHGEERR